MNTKAIVDLEDAVQAVKAENEELANFIEIQKLKIAALDELLIDADERYSQLNSDFHALANECMALKRADDDQVGLNVAD